MPSSLSRWIAGARFDGGLLIPVQPPRGAADLHLGPDRVELRRGDLVVPMDWAAYRNGLPTYPNPELTAWTIREWALGRGDMFGVGLGVSGSYKASTSALRKRTRTLANLVNGFGRGGVVVPLYPLGHGSAAASAERGFVTMLCDLASSREPVRANLADPRRVERFLGDVRASSLAAPPERTGARRATVEALIALRSLGYVHRFHGRPLPDEELDDEDHVAERVLHRMRTSRWAQGVEIDEHEVRDVILRAYAGVPPWPVQALLDP